MYFCTIIMSDGSVKMITDLKTERNSAEIIINIAVTTPLANESTKNNEKQQHDIHLFSYSNSSVL
jgi:hypothetical protein